MEKYAQYAALCEQIDTLEEQKKELRAEISKDVPVEGIKNKFLTIAWKVSKKWDYSKNVKDLEATLKAEIEAAKNDEQESGVATAEESRSLVFTPHKAK